VRTSTDSKGYLPTQEAHAVPVAGYKTDHWPAFYTENSGFKAPMRLDSALEVAQTIRTSTSFSE